MSRLIDASGLTGFTIPGGQIVYAYNSPGAAQATIAIKTSAGNDPSPTEPLFVAFSVRPTE